MCQKALLLNLIRNNDSGPILSTRILSPHCLNKRKLRKHFIIRKYINKNISTNVNKPENLILFFAITLKTTKPRLKTVKILNYTFQISTV